MEQSENMTKVIDDQKDFIISLYKEFIPIRALGPENGGQGEYERAKKLKEIMEKYFDDVKEIDVKDDRVPSKIRPNLIGTIKGKDQSKTLWIIAHMDTVPEGDRTLWKSDPFSVTVEGDYIYGRGVEDDGQAIVLGVTLAKILKELKLTPKFNFSLLISADEETGSKYGVSYLAKNYSLFGNDDIVLIPDAGNSDGSMIEVAEKSILWLKFTVIGKQAHASTPEKGVNAHFLSMILGVTLYEELHEKYDAKSELFDPPTSTFEITKVEKNVENVNTIPGKHSFYMDCRILPQYDVDDVLNTVNEVVKRFEAENNCKVEVEIANREDTTRPTDENSDTVKMLKNAIKAVKGIDAKTIGIGGGTYAKYLRSLGLNPVVWMTCDETAHEPNEYVRISYILSDLKVVSNMLV
ncbi:M20 family metallo-hydrolase [Acidianus sp. HS-5]|uniref:M20 family metallo-hydrolase n=1 Tax=Acidianus sp. HS-5 TaxID=2886040 RepID=UPI001F271D60|nr:M20 family metallo-hydrolase [Acidianus sp. HS-5]BDC18583.1 diaminopimelate aminotransferase [Acidianus sp. HS-5]